MRRDLDSFVKIESGLYCLYEHVDGDYVLRWRTRRIAVAYDSQVLDLYRFGSGEDLMRWAVGFRPSLPKERIEHFSISYTPSDHSPVEFNRLLESTDYNVIFLQKAGLV